MTKTLRDIGIVAVAIRKTDEEVEWAECLTCGWESDITFSHDQVVSWAKRHSKNH